MVAYKMIILYL